MYVGASILGDVCPATPKYLEVHYYCEAETATTGDGSGDPASAAADRSSRYSHPDAELDSLWKHNSASDVNIDMVLKAVKERNEESRVPITSPPSVSSTVNSMLSLQFPIQTSSLDDNDIGERAAVNTPNDDPSDKELQVDDASSDEKDLSAFFDKDIDEAADDTNWPNKAELESTESTTTMFILEVLTYVIAVICGIILNLLVIKVELTLYLHIFSKFYFKWVEHLRCIQKLDSFQA